MPPEAMDLAFRTHLEQLTLQLKSELLQHYDRDLQNWKTGDFSHDVSSQKPRILGMPRKPQELFMRGPKQLMSRRAVDSDSESSEHIVAPKAPPVAPSPLAVVAPEADAASEGASQRSQRSLELKTPMARAPPNGDRPFEPETAPQELVVSLPHAAEEPPKPPETRKDSVNSTNRSSRTSTTSSDSFATSSGDEPKNLPARCRDKRPSNASFSEFFKRQATVNDLYLFMQDEDSSRAAWLYAKFMNYFLTSAIIFTVWQANAEPVVPRFIEGIIQVTLECLMLLELCVHFFTSRKSERWDFIKNPYNIIDFLAILPVTVRFLYSFSAPSMEQNPWAHSLLYCFVPIARSFKLIRKFQKLQLLLHVLATTMDALKLLLFLVCLIVLIFGCAFYVLEPHTMDSLSTSIYLCTVTVTTVGTCDMNPTTWPGKLLAGALCLTSVLFMAMPLSVLGNAMSQTWADRHRIVLITQTRRKLKNLGYTAEHMPKLFGRFDKDGNGELEMDEFCDLVATLRIGMKQSEASELFLAFDENGDGGITEMEFMKALYPLDYRRIYRRASGVSFMGH